MNVSFLLHPKATVAYLYDDFTLRQALEKMHHHGYSAIPVISRSGKYISTISEGDLLWYIIDGEGGEVIKKEIHDVENIKITELLGKDKNPPIPITSSVHDLILQAVNQNFVPVIDDLGSFIGIITRKDIMLYLSKTE